jgi:phosphopantothenoylcysteine decarboxylase/phosphopantothenate--cysteine ligase
VKAQAHFDFQSFSDLGLHLGVCGSIAAYKSLDLLRLWKSCGLSVTVTLTDAAERFTPALNFTALGAAEVYGRMFSGDEGPFAHLAPGADAQAMVIAPATANILAKIACGLCDDMLSCQTLSFSGPVVLAPAMNPRMWRATATQENWQKLKDRGFICIEPEKGSVACEEEGGGRLARIEEIFLHGLKACLPKDMAQEKVLVTLGATREYWDPVRYWSNPSSGVQGAAVAIAAWLRGAEVTAVCGPGAPWLPADILRIDVGTAREMHQAATDNWKDRTIGVLTAAVADFRPGQEGVEKFKKAAARKGLSIEFVANPDILRELGADKGERKLAGFAAETCDIQENTRGKLETKNLDLVVGNLVGPGKGFGTAVNEVLVMDSTGRTESWPELPKTEIAWRLWDWILSL